MISSLSRPRPIPSLRNSPSAPQERYTEGDDLTDASLSLTCDSPFPSGPALDFRRDPIPTSVEIAWPYLFSFWEDILEDQSKGSHRSFNGRERFFSLSQWSQYVRVIYNVRRVYVYVCMWMEKGLNVLFSIAATNPE